MMLTRTTLYAMLARGEIWWSVTFAYKPANVKMADSMICCLVVVRRRHKRGIGYENVSKLGHRNYWMVTYEDENQEIQKDVDGAAADEEIIYIETVTLYRFVHSVPGIVQRTTAGISSTLGKRFGS